MAAWEAVSGRRVLIEQTMILLEDGTQAWEQESIAESKRNGDGGVWHASLGWML